MSVKDPKSIPKARSSHGVSAIKNTIYVFGGEHVPRMAIDSTLHSLNTSEGRSGAVNGIWKKVVVKGKKCPQPRIAHA